MTAPYRVGSPAVWIENDPEGMRVERTAVVAVRQDGDGWAVETLAGTELVDERGEGPQLVPLDAEMAVEFEERGPSFVVRSTVDDMSVTLTPALTGDASNTALGMSRIEATGTSVERAAACDRRPAQEAHLDRRGRRFLPKHPREDDLTSSEPPATSAGAIESGGT